MTEAEWMTCADPRPMLEFLHGKVSDRKFRLFTVACCRRIRHLINDRECRKAVDVAEEHADGLVTDRELAQADAAVTARVAKERLAAWSTLDGYVRYMAAGATQCSAKWGQLSYFAASAARCASQARSAAEGMGESEAQCLLLREIVGNPFRRVAIDPACRTDEVTQLAQAIYGEGAFERLHELTDALRGAGCDDATLLAHCHETRQHVRGCWALDNVLGKQ
jgi:hypothetical protein